MDHRLKEQLKLPFSPCFLSRCLTAASSHHKMTTTTCAWRVQGMRTLPISLSVILPTRRSVRPWDLLPTSIPGSSRPRAALSSVGTTADSIGEGPKSSQMRGWRCGLCCASCQPLWQSWPFSWIRSASPTLKGPSSFSLCAVICTVLPTW